MEERIIKDINDLLAQLFQKLKEAGYEWDAEKKELKKIVTPKFNVHDCIIKKHNSNINDFGYFVITDITGGKYWYNSRIICDISEQDEWEIYEPVRQKSATWNEKDERMYRRLHNLIYSTTYCDLRQELSDWLKSLKSRVQTLQKQEWSEGDDKMFNSALWHVKNSCGNGGKNSGEFEVYNWLKSLKDRVQPKQEWSEEDEKCIRLSTDIIDSALRAGFCVQLDRDRCVDWLKSLRPKSQWKPSDEQLEALKEACDEHWEPDGLDPLYTLYQDLKKLKG